MENLTPVSKLNHDEIAEIGAAWLRRNGYPLAFANYTDAMERELPDAIGINSWGRSFLLEAKISVSDFKADFKKRHRQDGALAYGDLRGYITTKGLLNPDDVPIGWWLLEVHGVNKPIVKVVKGVKKIKIKSDWCNAEYMIPKGILGDRRDFERGFDNVRDISPILIKILTRASRDGVDIEKYANGKFRGGYKL